MIKYATGKDWRDVFPLGGAQNVPRIIGGNEGSDPLLNYLYGPTFNIAGLRSGFLGPETGTIPYIIPSQATATLDMRLVVEMIPEEVIGHLRQHLDDHGFNQKEKSREHVILSERSIVADLGYFDYGFHGQ